MLIPGIHGKKDLHIVLRFALYTRVLSLILQAVLNALIPDHDADAFRPPQSEEKLVLDPVVELLFGGLGRWDAEHFLFIAEHGYVYEHNFAFFPLFPLLLRSLSTVLLWPMSPFLTLHGCLLVMVAVANSALFVTSAMALYGLSRLVLQDRKLALISSLVYCLTPASVFMLAGYSESLFALLTFSGLCLLERGFTPGACLLLGLATAARANGLANAGFLLYLPLQRRLAQVFNTPSAWHYSCAASRFLFTSALYVAVIAFPFCVFQLYGYYTFCAPALTDEQISPAFLILAREKGYRVPDAEAPTPSWCVKPVPVLYSYIQDVYWDVGFLRYFHLKQIPNFLLALPVASLSALALYVYVTANPRFCLCLGLTEIVKSKKDAKPPTGLYCPKVFVYIVHCSVLLTFGIFCMHVQVLTRFLASSSPVIYWISGHILLSCEPLLKEDKTMEQNPLKQNIGNVSLTHISNPVTQLLMHWRTCSFPTHCILGYFILYWFLGLALHCNFLPWT